MNTKKENPHQNQRITGSSLGKNAIISELYKLLPVNAVLHETEDLHPYECDGLSAYRHLPLIVVLPDTIEHVQAVLFFCDKHTIPVVARGAGTGLSGGALPLEIGVLLSMAKFNKILKIDPDNRVACVQPEVRNLSISQASEKFNLYYAPDPSSQIACTIGGNVAENSGGVHCLKYGLTVHNIQQLKIITMDGELITIGGSGFDSAGFDLLALMTGSEGMLGVIVEVTVILRPKPQRAQVILAAFDDIEKAGATVGNIIAAGIIPTGLEMMDTLAIQAAEDFVHAGYPVIEAALDKNNQMLPFEPPRFGEAATLGGTIACNFSGPRRPYAGAARDFVLGVKLINGRGEILSFGGEVMKNVAGYDISRLMCGALGTLGVLLEISLKVLPCNEAEITLTKELGEQSALDEIVNCTASSIPLSASLYDRSHLHLRLCGTSKNVMNAKQTIGGDELNNSYLFWNKINEHSHPFFNTSLPLWRISLSPYSPPLRIKGKTLIDWGGAQRWLVSDEPADKVRDLADKANGHAVLFRNGDRQQQIFHPLHKKILSIHKNLKQSFDPGSILNINRMYKEF